MATMEFTDEQLNYFRLCYVIIGNVPEGLRTVFKKRWNARYQSSHGQWIDAPKNGSDFYGMESPRNQKRNAKLLNIMRNGNTNEWDCTCLFYAILFSDCLGPYLNITVQKNIDDLRKIRNEVFAHTDDVKLSDVDFEDAMRKILAAFKALGLDTTQVDEMKSQKSFPTKELSSIKQQLNKEKKRYAKLHSFCVLPPKPSHDTIDREDEVMTTNQEMEKLRSTKKNETTFIYLSGNPGCGKSEIARQIGNNYFNKIPEDNSQLKFVFTFNASSIDTLLQSYMDFAARLSCDEDSVTRIATLQDLSPEEKIQKIKILINPKLQIYFWWLIIVDNVNDLKLVSKYLPQAGEKTSGDGQILVTTQDSQSIPIDSYTYHYSSLKSGMKEEDAIALLSQISGSSGDRDTLLKVASAFDFQPLALACAAVYMKRTFNYTDQCKAKREKYLLKLLEEKREATEKVFEKITATYPSPMTAAVRLALERVVSEDKIMMHAFQFLSVIANEPIPLKYVVQYVINCMPNEDQDLVAAHISLSSLVISSEDEDNLVAIRVHQVVYHCLQKSFENDGTEILKLMSAFSNLVSLKDVYKVTKAEISATRSFLPHFVVLSRKLNQHLLDQSNLTFEARMAEGLFKAGNICLAQGFYEASEILLEKCLSIQQSDYDSGSTEEKLRNVALANTNKSLIQLRIRLRDFKKAHELLEALVNEERFHKGDHRELATSLKKLGFCLMQLGEHIKAEVCLEEALEIHETYLCKKDLLMAGILTNLIMVLEIQGNLEKAKMYCEKVLEFEQTLYDSEDSQLADTINDLGVWFLRFKNHEKAATFFQKALEIQENLYPSNHPDKAIALKNLGVSLIALRNFEQAKPYLEKALSTILEKGDNENDPLLASTLHSLGLCLIELKQCEKAKPYLARALSIREKEDNDNNQQLVIALNTLGLCYFELKQSEKAKEYFEKARFIRERMRFCTIL